MPRAIMHGCTEDSFMLGTGGGGGGEFNELLNIYCIFFGFLNFWKTAPYPIPDAYSHGSVMAS